MAGVSPTSAQKEFGVNPNNRTNIAKIPKMKKLGREGVNP